MVFSLFTRWFHRYGLLVGWAVGMLYGTVEAYQVVNPVTGNHFGGSLGLIPGMERMGCIAVTAFVINVVLAARHSPTGPQPPSDVPAERRFSQASTTRAAMPFSPALPQARGS